MKLVVKDIDGLNFPQEFKSPKYYIDNLDKHFAIENVKSGDSSYSAEIKINQFNFFVGSNNSGKSRFMRGLLKLRNEPYIYFANEILYLDLLENLNLIYEKIEDKDLLIKFKLSFEDVQSKLPNKKSSISNLSKNKSENLLKIIENFKKGIGNKIDINTIKYFRLIEEIIKELWFSKTHRISKKTYTPILRSLLNNEYLGEDDFINTITKVFFENDRELNHINVNTGLDFRNKITRMRGTPKKRDIEKFESFLSKCFFQGKRVELLASNESLKLMSIAIDNGNFRSANEIGDGIQCLLLLLFPIFTAENNECFYIEEPETNLHPAFQRIFIETLLTNEVLLEKNLKYFFTTHSNHFLDLTLRSDKVSFFQFKKIEEGKHLIKTSIKPNRETLDLLGVNNTSVLLANTSLWVEGPTDRKYLSKFLKLYCKKKGFQPLKEDIDFAFFEYGGNLITHYLLDENEEFDENEIREKINAFALSSKIYLLVDNDNVKKGEAKFLRQKNLEKLAEENKYFSYQNTIVKEIENLLPVKIIKDFIPELLNTESSKKMAKNIIFKKNDYSKKGIAQFIEDTLILNNIPNSDLKKFRDKNSQSGTLTSGYKNKLANFVIDGEYTYSDLIEDNDQLKKLIEKLYVFIKN